jgi:hypothetical protein
LTLANRAPNFEEDEDEDLHLFAKSGRLSGGVDRTAPPAPYKPADPNRVQHASRQAYEDRKPGGHHHDYRASRQPASDHRDNNNSKGHAGNSGGAYRGGKPDEWHDPWDRSRQQQSAKKGEDHPFHR